MSRFLLRRVAGMLTTLLVASFLIFGSLFVAPGDPATFLLRGRSVSPEALAAIRAQYHLDDPFLVQYVDWLKGVITGNLGQSIQFRQEVSGLLTSRVPTTALLILYAAVLVVAGGVLLGAISATRQGLVDRTVLIGSSIATATPAFVAAIVLISAFSVSLGWFPAYGNGSSLPDRLYHLTLPAVALAVTLTGLLARVTRAAMLDELRREHVEVARSRGIPEAAVVRRHVLRNALGPIVTVTTVLVSGLLVSTAVVETAFGLSGVGSLLVQAVSAHDFPVVQAISLLGVVVFVVSNLAVDVVYPLIDPRVSLTERAG